MRTPLSSLAARLVVPCIALLLAPAPAAANVPAAYLPCEGKGDGEDCLLGGQEGTCVLDTLCTDSQVGACPACDKCVLCGDPCRGLAPGAACLLGDGGDGQCKRRAGCTDDPRFSFDECNHCLPTEGADCALHAGGTGHWTLTDGTCLEAGNLPDDDRCWKCVPGSGTAVKAEDGGCQASRGVSLRADTGLAALAWLGILALAGRELRRRRSSNSR